ncbi:MAG: hypothetical protein M0Q01_09705 [Syntrophales bacterium]|jgi:hypothetical protein|nr:hypothetical protein [Syntrophales bacterium]
MKTMTYTDARHMINRDRDFIKPLKSASLIRCFQSYIETSDWDEQIIHKEHLFNKICLTGVILSGLAITPFLIATLLK